MKHEKALDDVWPIGKKRAFFTLAIAFTLALLDMLDRQIMAALFPYLKQEFQFTDTQLGFLMSIVNISIAVMVIPSAYFIDRWSRKKMLALMGVVWSIATGACAFAGTYSHLLAARFFVGAGEAGYNPAAQSLLSASFPRRLRATALGFMQVGMAVGTPLGLLIGAFIASRWGWRHALGIVAVPGFFISLLALFMSDFKTHKESDAESGDSSEGAPAHARPAHANYLVEMVRILRDPTLLCVFFAQALFLVYQTASISWLPSYFQRVAGMSIPEASGITALCLTVSSVCMMLSGPALDLLFRRSESLPALWQMLSCCISFALLVYAFRFAVPGSALQIGALLCTYPFFCTLTTLGFTITNNLNLPHMRATAISLLVTVQNVFGMMIGPVLTGFLSDTFDLATSLLVAGSLMLISGGLYCIVSRTYPRRMAAMPTTQLSFK